ncbi:hypothetical protein NIE88_03530 [Sporolactobacillus shoreicorticis]|uniref:Transposase n=1 Tax=Sporolactobacillus shoreicorticis TaxID=1923877 RepID=A0ABW5RYH9_9BACL|nr:hypothetical protein [Sporolactobacillus shoreicorticis]MCO7124845.1 hypothetical protein [Sporolactobacillus shoreicorticis]
MTGRRRMKDEQGWMSQVFTLINMGNLLLKKIHNLYQTSQYSPFYGQIYMTNSGIKRVIFSA